MVLKVNIDFMKNDTFKSIVVVNSSNSIVDDGENY